MSIVRSILQNIQASRAEKNSRYAAPQKPAFIETPKQLLAEKWDKPFLKSMEWKKFEEVSMEYLKIKNCNANVTCTGADGGIDIKISDSKGKVFAIGQCKSWTKPIGVSLIRELYGIMAANSVRHGIFLTTSEYSKDALEFARGKNLLLIDSDEFVSLVNNLDEINRKRINNLARAGDYQVPTCVKCDVKMVKRKAKSGKNAGAEFWGCVNYPRCKLTMQVRN
jgi:restriction system protein